MGDSSSVRIETAQELLKSACFIIGLNYNSSSDAETIQKQLVFDDFDLLYKSGFEEVKSKVKEGEVLLQKAFDTSLNIQNYSYKKTLEEIETFFELYDIYNFAHQIPCMIDYPLAQAVSENIQGIDYINEYLRRLIIENVFCRRFETDTVVSLLKSISTDHKGSHLNIFEVVAANVLALTLLKGDIHFLDITEHDRHKLFTIFSAWQEKRVTAELRAAATALCLLLDITDGAAIDYLTNTILDIQPRLQQSMKTKQLDNVFLSLYREPIEQKPIVSYIDGDLMDNEKLRTLIGEISSCRYASDKIALVKQHVRSLRDYIEILNICFWDEECIVLFDSLTREELKYLRLALKQKQSKFPEWTSESGWENYLMDYVQG